MSLRAAAEFLRTEFAVGQRRACELLGMARSSFRYQSKKQDEELQRVLVQLAQETAAAVKGLAALDELRELELQLAPPLTAVLAPAGR